MHGFDRDHSARRLIIAAASSDITSPGGGGRGATGADPDPPEDTELDTPPEILGESSGALTCFSAAPFRMDARSAERASPAATNHELKNESTTV